MGDVESLCETCDRHRPGVVFLKLGLALMLLPDAEGIQAANAGS